MVDALRMAREWIVPSGCVLDLHPTAGISTIYVGQVAAGPVDTGGASARHQGATDAIASAARDRLLTIQDALEFDFWLHADSLDELADYIVEHWRESRIGGETLSRARELLRQQQASKVSVHEMISATRLKP